MSEAAETAYEFGDSLPIEPIEAGSTILIAGPALSRAEDLALSMVADGSDTGDGMLFVTTNESCERLLGSCRRLHPSFDATRAGVIDCTGQDLAQSQFDIRVKSISTQSDLTGIGMRFSALYESLYADADGGRVRTGLISLSSLSMYVDMRALFRFAQTLSGRIDSAGGLGLFSIDPTTHDTKTVNTISQVADGRIEVREPEESDADGELRIRGLRGQPDGWQPFTLPG
jgi:KaiC/GvpD/RAD55 family RecA-like ATPase